jgi:methylglutaconyl-CoA hydratase
MEERQVLISKDEKGIAILTLNRLKAANAFSVQMLHELKEIIDDLRFDQSVRCVIVTGSGENIFCAGADLKERAEMDEVEVKKTISLIRENINSLERLPKPVIAAVNGAAFGGGTELALACDIRIAATNAKFGLTETSLGIIPGAGGTQRLPRLIGKGKAKELIFTARRIDVVEAEKIGLVEQVTYPETIMEEAIKLAEEIVKNGPIAVTQAKLAIDKGYEADINTGLAIEQNAYEITIPTEDRLEGLCAFKEKRLPDFKGK